MRTISRREFLVSLATGLGVVAVDQFITACTASNITPSPTSAPRPTSTRAVPPTANQPPQHSPTPGKTSETQPDSPATATAAPVMGSPDLVVTRNGEPEDLVRRSIAALGGMERFVPKGSKVVIKPNICVAYHTYEYAATTNPWVVAALVKLCLEAGASKVSVMDAPFGGTAQEAYKKSGIEEQVLAAGGEMTFMPGFKYVSTDIPNGKDLRKTDVFDDVLKADVLINVPIAKHHSLARLTLGTKNLMGVIRDRSALHRNIGQRLADLLTCVRPTLTVVDAVRILTDHGPGGGNLDDVQKLDTVIVSPDTVAADSYAATLFGLKPEDIKYIQAAAEMGIGRSDLSNLRIEELQVGA